MIHVLIIVPYPELLDRVSKILDTPKYQEAIDATIQLMTVDKVDQVVSSGYDLIIARGYTAVTLSQKQNIPILPLPITTLDILHAIMDCRNTVSPMPHKIGCIGRGSEFESLNTLTNVLNIPIYVSTTNTYVGVEQCVQDAIDRRRLFRISGCTGQRYSRIFHPYRRRGHHPGTGRCHPHHRSVFHEAVSE